MTNIIIPPAWKISDRATTPENVYYNRRAFLRTMGIAALGSYALLNGCSGDTVHDDSMSKHFIPINTEPLSSDPFESLLAELPVPVTKDPTYSVSDRPLTPYVNSSRHNNYYEFTTNKGRVHVLAQGFKTSPWNVEVAGLAERTGSFGLEDVMRIAPMEERVYRFRCVEAWAMTVPWVGFPLSEFIKWCQPTEKANYVRFVSVHRPEEMVGQQEQDWYSWPYYEGLRMDEAMNEMALLTFGLYGKVLPNQNGAPIRIITPWKYGYKSAKAIVKVEFLEDKPSTFWNDSVPDEYGFWSNVDPEVSHPRWSQATERLISTGERVPTLKYNGYGDQVAHMYTDGQEYF